MEKLNPRVLFSSTRVHVSVAFIHLKLYFRNQFVKWLSGSLIDGAASGRELAVMQPVASWRSAWEMSDGHGISGSFNVNEGACAALFFSFFYFLPSVISFFFIISE